MRGIWMAAPLLAVAACGEVNVSPNGAGEGAAHSEGYTIEVRAGAQEQAYLVTAPDGRIIGARAAEGASALMDASRAQALAGAPPPQGEAGEEREVMSLRLPGFEMSVAGSDEDVNGENGRVNIAIGGEGRRVVVNADEGGPGDADDRAYIRITGADEHAVREFIAEADELSPLVQAQMLAELGLEEGAPKP